MNESGRFDEENLRVEPSFVKYMMTYPPQSRVFCCYIEGGARMPVIAPAPKRKWNHDGKRKP
jgi:hypothetical protein